MNTENNENQEEKKTSQQMHKVKTIIIDTGKIRQTKAFARQDGAILGAVWIVSFVCTMLAVDPQYRMLGFISNILIIATPFVVAKRLKAFRDYARDGHISFRHAFYYCIQTFFNATHGKEEQTTAYKITINKRQTDKYKIMDISVIIPLFNEEESLPELFAWIKRVMASNDFTYEVIFVNDGSTDRSWNVIEELAEKNEQVKGIKFRRNYGKSPALFCGFKEAQGDVVITMDADLQDSPDEIPGLYQMIMKEGYDLVSGYKQNRKEGDPLSKTIPTKLFNATARKVSGIHNLHDFNCGLKAYRLDVVKNIEVYGEMHRYIPYLAKNAGFAKIGEKPVHHQARKFGKSKFMGWNRFVNGYLDLMTLWFLSNFGKKPMHVFGFLGSVVFFIAFLSLIGLGIDKAIDLHNGIYGHLITDSPYFFIALVAMVLGSQLFLAGFLGDLISRQNPNRNDYQIEKEIRCGK